MQFCIMSYVLKIVICDFFSPILKLKFWDSVNITKSILFSTKNKKKKIGTLEKKYGNINIKHYSKVTCVGCELDENLSGEAMALKVIKRNQE